jgi:hypothetical protein
VVRRNAFGEKAKTPEVIRGLLRCKWLRLRYLGVSELLNLLHFRIELVKLVIGESDGSDSGPVLEFEEASHFLLDYHNDVEGRRFVDARVHTRNEKLISSGLGCVSPFIATEKLQVFEDCIAHIPERVSSSV